MHRHSIGPRVVAIAVVTLLGLSALAADKIRTERVQFERGASSTVIEGSITGYETVDYLLGARLGQAMNVSMATNNGANYFNILAPGETEVAMFIGSTSGTQYEGVLSESGDYTIRVYMMRSAARRNEVASYRLEISIGADDAQSRAIPPASSSTVADVTAAAEEGGPRAWEVAGVSDSLNLREQPSATAPTIARYVPGTILDNLGCRRAQDRVWCDVQELGGGPRGYVAAEFLKPAVSPDGSVATGPGTSTLRAGQGDFDATGQIPCAQYAGQPLTQCDFGVARAAGGGATVAVTKPDGRTRAIFFSNGIAIGADTSEADFGEFSASRDSDLNLIRVGDEHYEIPDAVIFGG